MYIHSPAHKLLADPCRPYTYIEYIKMFHFHCYGLMTPCEPAEQNRLITFAKGSKLETEYLNDMHNCIYHLDKSKFKFIYMYIA